MIEWRTNKPQGDIAIAFVLFLWVLYGGIYWW